MENIELAVEIKLLLIELKECESNIRGHNNSRAIYNVNDIERRLIRIVSDLG